MSLVGPRGLFLLGGLIFPNFTLNISIIEHRVNLVDTSCLSVYCLGHVQFGGARQLYVLL